MKQNRNLTPIPQTAQTKKLLYLYCSYKSKCNCKKHIRAGSTWTTGDWQFEAWTLQLFLCVQGSVGEGPGEVLVEGCHVCISVWLGMAQHDWTINFRIYHHKKSDHLIIYIGISSMLTYSFKCWLLKVRGSFPLCACVFFHLTVDAVSTTKTGRMCCPPAGCFCSSDQLAVGHMDILNQWLVG